MGAIMKLKHAKLCLDCEQIFSKGKRCPGCSSTIITDLTRWVPSILDMKDAGDEEEDDTYGAKNSNTWGREIWERVSRRIFNVPDAG
jgi:hypothetical protein